MPEDIGKELLMLGGTIVGFIAALLTVMEKLIDIQHRLGSRKDRKTPVPQERQIQESASSIDFFSAKPFRGTSYLLMYETGVIVAAGLLLNYVGLTLSRHLESILFLDMTGTASTVGTCGAEHDPTAQAVRQSRSGNCIAESPVLTCTA